MKEHYRIYGIRAVIEAINADKAVDKVFIQRGLQGTLFRELESLIRAKGVSSSYVPVEKLNRLGGENHQGVIANISPVAYHSFESLVENVLEKKKLPLFLLLDQLSDVRNFGAIIRTAECTGVDGIIVPKHGSAPLTADTIKTSAGAAFKIPIAKVSHLKDAIYYLQSSGLKVVAATEKADTDLYEIALDVPLAVVMGAEGKGISPSLLKTADVLAKLPMLGEIASLNVSVACGVFLYEILRQRL